ncbi:flotillin family protein [Tessaracoccus coleopterorum]|uniref:flotillin family protein n=1 Tax=Tessaracoccus coleopterorum TaxID=2714950 RepID=UPI001E2B55FF|nr:flotillin family protein [Tessaracoccus coleopterorum]
MPPVLTAVLGLLALLVLIGLLIASRYKVAKPSEAFIITGRKGKEVRNPETGLVSTDLSGQKVVMGGGVFVVPFIQRLHVLDLSSRRIMVTIRNAVSGQGIKLNVDGVAIVKVGGNEDSIRAAAQRFLSQQDEIEPFTQETLAGSLRSIVGSLTVEQIIRDRAAFAQRVTDESESSLTGQGLVLDTFQIQDITDDGTYLSDLGRPESAKLGRMAAVAEAEARREAEQAQIAAEQQIAIAQRELVLKQAEIQSETDAARATAAASGPLAQADRDQAILQEQEKVAVAQAALKERQLDTEVRRPRTPSATASRPRQRPSATRPSSRPMRPRPPRSPTPRRMPRRPASPVSARSRVVRRSPRPRPSREPSAVRPRRPAASQRPTPSAPRARRRRPRCSPSARPRPRRWRSGPRRSPATTTPPRCRC